MKWERGFKMKPKYVQMVSGFIVLAMLLAGCSGGQYDSGSGQQALSNSEAGQLDDEKSSDSPDSSDSPNTQQTEPPVSQTDGDSDSEGNTVEKMTLQIGNNTFTATLENNDAVDALVDMMREAPIVIQMSDYSGFEKVGSLGTSLPASNKQTTTQSGDIVLYNGNQIVIFYGFNSWSYTRLGRIDDLSGWEDALGSGDITVTLSLR